MKLKKWLLAGAILPVVLAGADGASAQQQPCRNPKECQGKPASPPNPAAQQQAQQAAQQKALQAQQAQQAAQARAQAAQAQQQKAQQAAQQAAQAKAQAAQAQQQKAQQAAQQAAQAKAQAAQAAQMKAQQAQQAQQAAQAKAQQAAQAKAQAEQQKLQQQQLLQQQKAQQLQQQKAPVGAAAPALAPQQQRAPVAVGAPALAPQPPLQQQKAPVAIGAPTPAGQLRPPAPPVAAPAPAAPVAAPAPVAGGLQGRQPNAPQWRRSSDGQLMCGDFPCNPVGGSTQAPGKPAAPTQAAPIAPPAPLPGKPAAPIAQPVPGAPIPGAPTPVPPMAQPAPLKPAAPIAQPVPGAPVPGAPTPVPPVAQPVPVKPAAPIAQPIPGAPVPGAPTPVPPVAQPVPVKPAAPIAQPVPGAPAAVPPVAQPVPVKPAAPIAQPVPGAPVPGAPTPVPPVAQPAPVKPAAPIAQPAPLPPAPAPISPLANPGAPMLRGPNTPGAVTNVPGGTTTFQGGNTTNIYQNTTTTTTFQGGNTVVQPGQPGFQPGPQQVIRRDGGIGAAGAAAIGVGAGLVGGYLLSNQMRGGVNEVRSYRQSYVDSGVTYVREPGRVIIREPGGAAFIRSDESERFAILGYQARQERDGAYYRNYYDRPDGIRIINITDDSGRLVRRVRRYGDGREVIIIDNSFRAPPARFADQVVVMAPPVLTIPRERYIVDAGVADEASIYEALTAAPLTRVSRRYTLDEVRYSPTLRAQMRSVDVNTITFETGSWFVDQSQVSRLATIAAAINKAIQVNASEVFLIEGHTDAVGDPNDNLSLSDRRAQSVAEILTRDYGIPAENLEAQGYGETQLRVQTDGAARANRRVTIRRITSLITGTSADVSGTGAAAAQVYQSSGETTSQTVIETQTQVVPGQTVIETQQVPAQPQ